MSNYTMNCTQCGNLATANGESSTYVGYMRVDGHLHDDNTRVRRYVCHTCNHSESVSIINTCDQPGCDWTGSNISNPGCIKVPRWPYAYDAVTLRGVIPGHARPSGFNVLDRAHKAIQRCVGKSSDTRIGPLERCDHMIDVLKQEICDKIVLALCYQDLFTDPDDLKDLHDSIRAIHRLGCINLKLAHDHNLFELIEKIIMDNQDN